MKNWLLTADVHIDDYPSYNKEKRSRLNQFIDLANRYVELAKENDCDTIVLAGDTINKPTNKPYVISVLYEFISILKKNFSNIYYVLGQHDLDSKTNEINDEDTILTIFRGDNIKYMDHQILTMPSGKRIAFKDWTPKQDVSWIDQEVDILIAHFTKSSMFGQEVDESKFDLMIHGDIHNDQEIGKFISIGNPIQLNMSSQKNGTCIILNPDTCEWKRIKVDPDNSRFLRFHYTRSRDEEGFADDLNYYIYKPVLVGGNDTNIKSQLPDWNEIDDLIADSVASKGLSTIHSEVLSKNPKYTEMDFNFSLKRLKIHGYRSIVDLEIDFEGKDRIILVGDNGSGKSSVVRALKAVFEKSRNLATEKSDFTPDAKVELEFTYQDKLYKVWRGTNDWGIEIDSKRINYNNKTEFENDIYHQLPFMSYVDLFFINSNESNLDEKFSPSRRITLLSRFYRLDRINAYCETVSGFITEKDRVLKGLNTELSKCEGQYDMILKSIEEYSEYAGKSREEYLNEVEKLKSIIERNKIRLDWQSKLDRCNDQITLLNDNIKKSESKLTLNEYDTRESIKTFSNKISELNEKINSLNNDYKSYLDNQTRLKMIESDGKRINTMLDSLKERRCPTCGSLINSEELLALKTQYEQQRENLRTTYMMTRDSLKIDIPEEGFQSAIKKLELAKSELSTTLNDYNTRLALFLQARNDYDLLASKCADLEDKKKYLLMNEPEDVVVPNNITELLTKAATELNRYDTYKSSLEKKEELENTLEYLNSSFKSIHEEITNYTNYSKLLSQCGDVMYAILQRMATAFSDSEIEYRVNRGVFRGKDFIEFNEYLNVKGKWREYSSLSDGQKTIADLDFLNKLFSVKSGLLVLDESLKHLDYNNGPHAWSILRGMNVNSILISTHDANFSNYTRKIELELDSEGKTQATFI